MRFFNTTGPIETDRHYCVPPLERVDLREIHKLVRQRRYFVLHAPRQTGKTSTLLALKAWLNAQGDHECVYANFEAGQAAGEDTEQAMRAMLGELASRARAENSAFPQDAWPRMLADAGPFGALADVLTEWSRAAAKPLVLLIDEVDALIGDTLLAVLRQLRSRYDRRPREFPQNVLLCGVRDVRDYRIRSGSTNEIIAGGSAFNVKAKSLRLGDFSQGDVDSLLEQHRQETGQQFAATALETIWEQTQGQPWLVNALADECCEAVADREIRAEDVRDAQERIVARRETHLDQLADKLREDRVRRVVEPLLSGGERRAFTDRDIEYARDLGLLAQAPPLRIANPIYAEVVPRELTWVAQEELPQEAAWYTDAAGALDVVALMESFQAFFREHSQHWRQRFLYQEAWPQLLLQAFLQRVVNGGGRVEREYGLGRGRTDLLIVWPERDRTARHVIECKVLRRSAAATVAEGLQQTAGYMDKSAADSGHLVVFDRDEDKRWSDKIFHRVEHAGRAAIHVWGM